MSDSTTQADQNSEIENALLDAELFVKYRAPERAMKRLLTALHRNPRSIQLRERLREVAASHKHSGEAAKQCLALASLYIEREDLDSAYDRLLEAKQLDPRINIASGLEAIRRARRPDLAPAIPKTEAHPPKRPDSVLAGDLTAVSVFDAIQIIENAKLTGSLLMNSGVQTGLVYFDEGRIVGAECADAEGELGFRRIVEMTSGNFEFDKTTRDLPVTIKASSNTNLILDTLRRLDEEKR
jgi:Domain of unknown function (DUF4388)